MWVVSQFTRNKAMEGFFKPTEDSSAANDTALWLVHPLSRPEQTLISYNFSF